MLPTGNRCITAAPANLRCDDPNMGSSQRWRLWQSLWWFVSSVLAHWSARAQGIRLQRQSTFSCQFALQFWARLGSQQYSTIRTRKTQPPAPSDETKWLSERPSTRLYDALNSLRLNSFGTRSGFTLPAFDITVQGPAICLKRLRFRLKRVLNRIVKVTTWCRHGMVAKPRKLAGNRTGRYLNTYFNYKLLKLKLGLQLACTRPLTQCGRAVIRIQLLSFFMFSQHLTKKTGGFSGNDCLPLEK